PANRSLRRIEPEGPLVRAGRHDFVEQREVSALVRPSIGIEMDLKKTLSTGQIQTLPTHPVGADLAHRFNADQPAVRRSLWRPYMGHVRRQNEWCRMDGERH